MGLNSSEKMPPFKHPDLEHWIWGPTLGVQCCTYENIFLCRRAIFSQKKKSRISRAMPPLSTCARSTRFFGLSSKPELMPSSCSEVPDFKTMVSSPKHRQHQTHRRDHQRWSVFRHKYANLLNRFNEISLLCQTVPKPFRPKLFQNSISS